MKKLLEGLSLFQRLAYPRHKALFERLAKNQTPQAVFIACSDSRVLPNLIVQAEPGELFLIRNAGNIVPPAGSSYGGTTGSLEYAILALGIRHIIVCGHSDCGAMQGVLHPERLEGMPAARNWVSYAEEARRAVLAANPRADDETLVARLVDANVVVQIRNILTFPFVSALAGNGELDVHGWVYDIATGRVKGLDLARGVFEPLDAGAAGPARERAGLSSLEADEEFWEKL